MLLKHVNDLLDISKLEAGKLRIELQNDRRGRAGALHRFALRRPGGGARRCASRCETPASLVAPVDPEKLQRVVMNLLSNAFKFVPADGAVRCRLQTDERLCCRVDDSGPGVKPELRKAIFERFRQGDGGANRQVSGTGLGLAIAHEFVEMHKGTIEVLDSDLGGARFEVSLPAHASRRRGAHELARGAGSRPRARSTASSRSCACRALPRLRAAASEPTAGRPCTRAKVLVVEDNADMNRFVAQCLAAELRR